MDFAHYPVLEKKEFNSYCNKFKSFKILYTHMLNTFEVEEIKILVIQNLHQFFDQLEKILIGHFKSSQFASESSYKQ
jgi:hypothetical protein